MSRAFHARYPGRCGACTDRIEAGDEARFVDDEIVHDECADIGLGPDPVPVVCSTCHLTACDCGSETA